MGWPGKKSARRRWPLHNRHPGPPISTDTGLGTRTGRSCRGNNCYTRCCSRRLRQPPLLLLPPRLPRRLPDRDRVARMRTPCKVVPPTAMNAPATMEATTSASKAAATAATPGEGIVRYQCRAKQHDCCEKYQSIPHDIPPCDLVQMLSIERG